MKAIGYIRVSTEEQVNGVSLDNQEQRIKEYCEYKDFELTEMLRDEGITGSKNNGRDGFKKILDRVEANGIQAIIVYSLDRLSRDMLTLLAFERLLKEYSIQLHTLEGQIDTSSPDGFMSYAMRAFIGEMERRQVADRTHRAMQHKKNNGEVVGSIPYGYQRDGEVLIENSEEQRVKGLVNKLYQDDKKVSEIVRVLNGKGIKTRNGSEWAHTQVKRLVDAYETQYHRHSELGSSIKEFILNIA